MLWIVLLHRPRGPTGSLDFCSIFSSAFALIFPCLPPYQKKIPKDPRCMPGSPTCTACRVQPYCPPFLPAPPRTASSRLKRDSNRKEQSMLENDWDQTAWARAYVTRYVGARYPSCRSLMKEFLSGRAQVIIYNRTLMLEVPLPINSNQLENRHLRAERARIRA